MNTRLFQSDSVLVRISLVPYKYVPTYMCFVRSTYYIRIRIHAQQLKIHVIMIVRARIKVCNVLVFAEREDVFLPSRG